MNRDTLEIIEQIITVESVGVQKRIGETLADALYFGVSNRCGTCDDTYKMVWQILWGLLEDGFYQIYMDASCDLPTHYCDPRSTRTILEHFSSQNKSDPKVRNMVAFVKFLYAYTDEPWRVYVSMRSIAYNK